MFKSLFLMLKSPCFPLFLVRFCVRASIVLWRWQLWQLWQL
jgi:hypothetical protein